METLYRKNQYEIMKSYNNNVLDGKYIKDNSDLKNNDANYMYNNFIDSIIKSNVQEYFQNDFKKTDNVYKIVIITIVELFGYNEDVFDEIDEFFSKLNLSGDNSIFTGSCINIHNKITNENNSIIEVPSIDNLSSIISIVHEFIHFHIQKYNINLNKKYYYKEILPIYAEKVALENAKKLEIQEDLEKKIEQTRLEEIKWHYINDFQEKKKELIKSKEDLEMCKNYLNAIAQSYAFGYIYGEALHYYDLDDKVNTREKVRNVLNNEINIQELLDYFNINVKNKYTMHLANKKLNQVK